MNNNHFIFIFTNHGSETMLKADIRTEYPDWKPAFSQKGLVTFKLPSPLPSIENLFIHSPYARHFGLHITKCSPENLKDIIYSLDIKNASHLYFWKEGIRSYTHPKLQDFPLNTPNEIKNGETILNLTQINDKEIWIGLSVHQNFKIPAPGGDPLFVLPEEAPSRAFLKMKEMLLWSNAQITKGQTVLEIGAAPGGMSYCLLQNGVNVIGVDTAAISPICLTFRRVPNFLHIKKPLQILRSGDLSGHQIDWLVMDVNLLPREALFHIKELLPFISKKLQGMLLTLKMPKHLNRDEIDTWKSIIKSFGISELKMLQLPSNKQELSCFVRMKNRGSRETQK